MWEYSWAYAAGSNLKVTGLADHLFKIFVNMEFIHVCSVDSRVLEVLLNFVVIVPMCLLLGGVAIPLYLLLWWTPNG